MMDLWILWVAGSFDTVVLTSEVQGLGGWYIDFEGWHHLLYY